MDNVTKILSLKERKVQFVETLLEQSVSKNANDAVLEWTIINVIDNIVEKCICGNTNTVYYTLINMVNRNKLNVGFDCITKHFPLLKNNASILCKQFTYQKTSKTKNKRMCSACFKNTINKEEPGWKTICGNCYSSGTRTVDPMPMLGYRMCEGCFQLNIDPESESYKNCCLNCFKNSKIVLDESQCRNCSECCVKNIALTEPDYKNKCGQCFIKNKNVKEIEEDDNNRQCLICEKYNIKPTEPDYKDKCLSCYKETKKNEPKPTPRDCSVCNLPKLKSTDPEWKNKCTDCFKLSKDTNVNTNVGNLNINITPGQATMRECIVCKQANVPSSKPSFIQKCTKCYSQSIAGPSNAIPDIVLDMGNMDLMSKIMGKK